LVRCFRIYFFFRGSGRVFSIRFRPVKDATGMRDDDNHHDLVHRVASALAMTEAAGMEAPRKLGRRS
jgi:hypothetical protein